MKVSMRKSALKQMGLGGSEYSMYDFHDQEGRGQSRGKYFGGHCAHKDSKSYKPWQHQAWGSKKLAEFCPSSPAPLEFGSAGIGKSFSPDDKWLELNPEYQTQECQCHECYLERQSELFYAWLNRMEEIYPEAFRADWDDEPEALWHANLERRYPEAFHEEDYWCGLEEHPEDWPTNDIGWSEESATAYEDCGCDCLPHCTCNGCLKIEQTPSEYVRIKGGALVELA